MMREAYLLSNQTFHQMEAMKQALTDCKFTLSSGFACPLLENQITEAVVFASRFLIYAHEIQRLME